MKKSVSFIVLFILLISISFVFAQEDVTTTDTTDTSISKIDNAYDCLRDEVSEKKCSSLVPKKVSPHTIRHTTAMHMLQSNIDITVISKYLGHADLSATNKYVHLNIKMKREALDAINPQEREGMKIGDQPQWRNKNILAFLQDMSSKTTELCDARK